MGNKLADNLILNLELLDRKTFHDKEAGKYQIVNKQDALNLVGTDNLWLSPHLTNTMAVNNASAKPQVTLQFGSNKYAAYVSSSKKTYVYENEEWDGTTMNSIVYNNNSYFYESDGITLVGNGVLMTTSGASRTYYSINQGLIIDIGTYTPLQYNDTWNYCAMGVIKNETDDIFSNRKSDENDSRLYMYDSTWYTSWNYETVTTKANGVYLQYIHSNLYYYRTISSGKITSENYAYYTKPSATITFNPTSIGASGGSVTGNVSITSGTYWRAYISSGSGATISNNTNKQGDGSFTLTFETNSSSSSRSVYVTVRACYPNWEDATEGNVGSNSITQAFVPSKTIYVYWDSTNESVLKLTSNASGTNLTTVPFDLTVTTIIITQVKDLSTGMIELVEHPKSVTFPANTSSITWVPDRRFGTLSEFRINVTYPGNPHLHNGTNYKFQAASKI